MLQRFSLDAHFYRFCLGAYAFLNFYRNFGNWHNSWLLRFRKEWRSSHYPPGLKLYAHCAYMCDYLYRL
jgi:hypothetical protein